MTTEELYQIKDAAERIHAAAVAAGKWDPKPEWEAKLMDIVCDISRAVEADKKGKHADLAVFDEQRGPDEWEWTFESFIQGSVEDCLAAAVIDILDTVEGIWPDWEKIDGLAEKMTMKLNLNVSFTRFCFDSIKAITEYEGGPLLLLEFLKQWAEAHGIDLRRHVELKMKYNETLKS